MSNLSGNMDEQEKEIEQLSEDINPSEDTAPDSLAEVTTAAPLDSDELGGNAKEDDVKKQGYFTNDDIISFLLIAKVSLQVL